MTRTTETPQALFRTAADLVALALGQLDLRRHPPRVGEQRGRFFNFMHMKLYNRLEAIPRKLRQSADWLDHKDSYRRGHDNGAPAGAVEQEIIDETK